jgi:N-acetylmuramoyl-L-alanine amidase
MRNLTATEIFLIVFISACLGWTYGLLRLQPEKEVPTINVADDAAPKPKADNRKRAPVVSRPSARIPIETAVAPAPLKAAIPIAGGNSTASVGTVGRDSTGSVRTNAESERSLMDPNPIRFESSTRTFGRKQPRIVIDAGHGGSDDGSVGPTGFAEKDLVLDLSKRLQALLDLELGAEVVLTRSEDKFLDVESRTQIANREHADLFISIHANSSPVKTAQGAETFVLNVNTRSQDALTTASRENASYGRRINDLPDILSTIVSNDKTRESMEFAKHVQMALNPLFNARAASGVHGAPLAVLIGAKMPAVFVEVSYISNPLEEQRLRTSEYRQRIAESLLKGIKSYSATFDSTPASNLVKAP